MKSPDQKIDASMQAFAKRWMKSLNRPRASTTLGYFFVGLFILFWSTSLTVVLGFELRKGFGTLVFIGIALALTFGTLSVVRLMALLGIDRSTRSAFLFSAVIGPYANSLAEHAWNLPAVSHIVGFAGAILAFLLSLSLDKLLQRAQQKPVEV